jgi:hypothetical protein
VIDYNSERSQARIREEGGFGWDNIAAGGQGLVNYAGGFVNGAISLANTVLDKGINLANPLCLVLNTNCIELPDIPAASILGDYDSQRWSSYLGSLGFGEALLAVSLSAGSPLATNRTYWFGGGEAQAEARIYAATTGGSTILNTPFGQVLTALDKMGVPSIVTGPLWRLASIDYAAGASGTVQVFIGAAVPLESSMFFTTELQVLVSVAKVVFRSVY